MHILKTLKNGESFKKTKVHITFISKALARAAERRRRPTTIPAVLRVEFTGCEVQNVGLAEGKNYIPPLLFCCSSCSFSWRASRHSVIPYARIQNDEALFAAGIYSPPDHSGLRPSLPSAGCEHADELPGRSKVLDLRATFRGLAAIRLLAARAGPGAGGQDAFRLNSGGDAVRDALSQSGSLAARSLHRVPV